MLYREIIAVWSRTHTKHTNTLCGQNANLINLSYDTENWLALVRRRREFGFHKLPSNFNQSKSYWLHKKNSEENTLLILLLLFLLVGYLFRQYSVWGSKKCFVETVYRVSWDGHNN